MAATLFAGCVLNNLSQVLDVADQQCIPAARDETDSREAIELTGHSFPMGADAASDFSMRGCWDDMRTIAHATGQGSPVATPRPGCGCRHGVC